MLTRNVQEAIATFRRDQPEWDQLGIGYMPGASPLGYWPSDATSANSKQMALDAVSTVPATGSDPSSSIPALLTTFIDPQVYEWLFAPNTMADVLGEERKGSWTDQTMMLPVVEATGETSSYGDFNNNGRAGINANFPQLQSYLFQLIKQWGELELARMGLARIQLVGEIDKAAAINMNKFANYVYAVGVVGIQNYGLTNNPYLTASLTPGVKAAGGVAWTNSSNQVVATANEIFTDIQTLYETMVVQNPGLVRRDTNMTLVLSPVSEMALTATNSFNVNVSDLLTKNFKNLKVKNPVQYQVKSTSNPQGVAGGNFVQLIADELEGQKTGYAAYNEKMRAFPIIRQLSSFQQKILGGVFGFVLRQPSAVVSMLGV
jgi:hypothetical protein